MAFRRLRRRHRRAREVGLRGKVEMVSTPLWATGQHYMGCSRLQRGLCWRACDWEWGVEAGKREDEEQVKVASAFLGFLGSQGNRGGGQL